MPPASSPSSSISSHRGVDGPATAHAAANMNLGATREFLERCVLVMVPLVGYPRSLAALAAIKNAAESRNS